MFRKSNINKTLFLVLLKYREIITVKTVALEGNVKSLKSKKKKLALTSLYYVSQEIWLDNSKKLIYIDRGSIIRTGIICNKISCYMRQSPCRWLIAENPKIFRSYVKHF